MSVHSAVKRPGYVFAAVLLTTVTLAGCFGTTSEDSAEQATDDCDVDRCIEVAIDAIECPEEYDNMQEDNVCLAYNGEIPGPTWVFHEGERVVIELHHRVAETISALDVDDALAARLSEARYSMHRHGISQVACSDGVSKPEGTNVCDSTVGRGQVITYTFDTVFSGYWHYHDHTTVGRNVEAEEGPVIDREAKERGLFGAYVVLPPGEITDHAFTLHVMDWADPIGEEDVAAFSGFDDRYLVNGGLGLHAQVHEGDRFDINVVSLGQYVMWEVTLEDDAGRTLAVVHTAPGASNGITVKEATSGSYTWKATPKGDRESLLMQARPFLEDPALTPTFEGTIEVMPGPPDPQREPLPAQGPIANDIELPVPTGPPDREYRLRMSGHDFNGAQWPDTPLLEAYPGEVLHFTVYVPEYGPPVEDMVYGAVDLRQWHTFHLHGHPWEDTQTGEMIDTKLVLDGEIHEFQVIAGLGVGQTGDWLYHCHMDVDHSAGMWGLLRVYDHHMVVEGGPGRFFVTVHEADGTPVENAVITVRWNPDAPLDPTLATAHAGTQIAARVTGMNPGTYGVHVNVPEKRGELVIESTHETGNSLARLTLLPDGGWVENRDVGLDLPGDLLAIDSDPKEDILS